MKVTTLNSQQIKANAKETEQLWVVNTSDKVDKENKKSVVIITFTAPDGRNLANPIIIPSTWLPFNLIDHIDVDTAVGSLALRSLINHNMLAAITNDSALKLLELPQAKAELVRIQPEIKSMANMGAINAKMDTSGEIDINLGSSTLLNTAATEEMLSATSDETVSNLLRMASTSPMDKTTLEGFKSILLEVSESDLRKVASKLPRNGEAIDLVGAVLSAHANDMPRDNRVYENMQPINEVFGFQG